MAGIIQLPVEILQRIFISGCEIDADFYLTGAYIQEPQIPYLSRADKYRAREGDGLHRPQLKQFADPLLLVCRFWNEVVQTTPRLWYAVASVKPWPMNFSEMERQISESSNVDLDIQLYALRHDPLDSEYEKIDRMLRNCKSRIRVLRVVGTSLEFYTNVISIINGLGALPSLEFMGFGHKRFNDDNYKSTPFELTVRTPAMRILSVQGLVIRPSTGLSDSPTSSSAKPTNPIPFHPSDLIQVARFRYLHLDLLWFYPLKSTDPQIQHTSFPYLTGLRLSCEPESAFLLLRRLHLPRIESLLISLIPQWGADYRLGKVDPEPTIRYPSLKILRFGGESFLKFAKRWKKVVEAPNLQFVQFVESLAGHALVSSSVRSWDPPGGSLTDYFDTSPGQPGFTIELLPSDSNDAIERGSEKQFTLLVNCFNFVTLDFLHFFNLSHIAHLKIRRSKECRTSNLSMGARQDTTWNMPLLRSFSLTSYAEYTLPLHFPDIFLRLTKVELQAPVYAATLKIMLKDSTIEELRLIVTSFGLDSLGALIEIEGDGEQVPLQEKMRRMIISNRSSPVKRKAAIAPQLKYLDIAVHDELFLGPNSHPKRLLVELSQLLKKIISRRHTTVTPLERLTVDATVPNNMKEYCKSHGVKYVVSPNRPASSQIGMDEDGFRIIGPDIRIRF